MAERELMTEEGYNKLIEERDLLSTVRRKEVADRLKEAISYGDLSENSEYAEAKDAQMALETRISELNYKIRNAEIIREEDVKGDTVNVGLTVTVKDQMNGSELRFALVGSPEVDPFADPARISTDSAIGEQLLGKKVGDVAEIQTLDGVKKFEVMSIERNEK